MRPTNAYRRGAVIIAFWPTRPARVAAWAAERARLGGNVRHLTIRSIPVDLAESLKREQRIRGQSLNQTVIDLLSQSLGVRGKRSNGLARLAGRWSPEELQEFERVMAVFEQVDAELWQ